MTMLTVTEAWNAVVHAFPSLFPTPQSVDVWIVKAKQLDLSGEDVRDGLLTLIDLVAEGTIYPDDRMPRLLREARAAKARRIAREQRITEPSRQLPATVRMDPLLVAAYQLTSEWYMTRLGAKHTGAGLTGGAAMRTTEAQIEARAQATFEALALAREHGVTVHPAQRAAWCEGMLAARALGRVLSELAADTRAARRAG